jgi:glutamate carboxypeptidase
MSALQALRGRLSDRRDEMLALTRVLVEAESPSGDEAGSSKVAGLLADSARAIGAVTSVECIPVGGYGKHLVVRSFAHRASAGTILLLGHTDTVHPRGSVLERPWRVNGSRIYGPGVFDMKANCALALEVLRACAAEKVEPRFAVTLLLTCDEESGSATGRPLIEDTANGARCALVLEPSAPGGKVKTARKGTGMFTMTVHGLAAHAGLEPEKGASAVLEIARQIERLHGMNQPECGTTVNVGVVQGGTLSNVVAAEARAEIDVRFSTLAEAKRLEEAILGSESFDERVRISVKGGINRPPLERTDGVAALYELAKGIAARLGYELGEESVGGASDGNFVAAKGVPVLDGLGIQGDGAHAVHEHIIAEDIVDRGALLAGLIASI